MNTTLCKQDMQCLIIPLQGEKGENGLPGHDGKPVSTLC